MKTSLVAVSLLLSLLSVFLQVKKTNHIPLFDKYMVPAGISEYDFRVALADQQMIRDSAEMRQGMGVPFVRRLSDDHQQIVCRVLISEKGLPESHSERRAALLGAAWSAVGSVASQFNLSLDDKTAMHAVRVEFMSIEALAKGGEKAGAYADFVDGEIAFH